MFHVDPLPWMLTVPVESAERLMNAPFEFTVAPFLMLSIAWPCMPMPRPPVMFHVEPLS